MDTKTITGTINYQDIETGYWALKDETTNTNYRITNILDELKEENLRIRATVQELNSEFSIFMSGKAIKIIEYKKL